MNLLKQSFYKHLQAVFLIGSMTSAIRKRLLHGNEETYLIY